MSYTPPDRDYLRDILEAAKEIAEFMAGLTRDDFAEDRKTQKAVVRNIEIMGEATKRLSRAIREALPDIPWQDIAGMRDVLIHAYDHVDVEEVWQVAMTDVPILIAHLAPLVGGE